MDCFNHSGTAAVGLCKHCGKGLCTTCATDLEFGLACRNAHEAQVTALNAMTGNTMRMQSMQRALKRLVPAWFLVMGALFVAPQVIRGGFDFTLDVGFGVLCLVLGFYLLAVVRKTNAPTTP